MVAYWLILYYFPKRWFPIALREFFLTWVSPSWHIWEIPKCSENGNVHNRHCLILEPNLSFDSFWWFEAFSWRGKMLCGSVVCFLIEPNPNASLSFFFFVLFCFWTLFNIQYTTSANNMQGKDLALLELRENSGRRGADRIYIM